MLQVMENLVDNISIVKQSLQNLTTQSNNVAVGNDALKVSTATSCVAVGHIAFQANTTGGEGTAVGKQALK